MIIKRILIKKFFASILYNTGILHRRLNLIPNGYGSILTYHRLLPAEEVTQAIEPGMYVTPGTFEKHVSFIKKHFEIISLQDFQIKQNAPKTSAKTNPFCSITFDDGWIDFFKHAYPIIEKHQIPCTVFLPTSYIGTNKEFWTDKLARLLELMFKTKDLPTFQAPLLNQITNLRGPFEKKLHLAISLLKSCSYSEIEKILKEMSAGLKAPDTNPLQSFISWDQARDMSLSGLVTFGSHTVNHAILTTLNKKEISYELEASKDKLLQEGVVDSTFIPFCYPNGNYSSEIAELVIKAGYQLSVTTESGWNSLESDTFTLKRVSMHQDISSTNPLFLYRLLQCL